jgi:hypothetical protein
MARSKHTAPASTPRASASKSKAEKSSSSRSKYVSESDAEESSSKDRKQKLADVKVSKTKSKSKGAAASSKSDASPKSRAKNSSNSKAKAKRSRSPSPELSDVSEEEEEDDKHLKSKYIDDEASEDSGEEEGDDDKQARPESDSEEKEHEEYQRQQQKARAAKKIAAAVQAKLKQEKQHDREDRKQTAEQKEKALKALRARNALSRQCLRRGERIAAGLSKMRPIDVRRARLDEIIAIAAPIAVRPEARRMIGEAVLSWLATHVVQPVVQNAVQTMPPPKRGKVDPKALPAEGESKEECLERQAQEIETAYRKEYKVRLFRERSKRIGGRFVRVAVANALQQIDPCMAAAFYPEMREAWTKEVARLRQLAIERGMPAALIRAQLEAARVNLERLRTLKKDALFESRSDEEKDKLDEELFDAEVLHNQLFYNKQFIRLYKVTKTHENALKDKVEHPEKCAKLQSEINLARSQRAELKASKSELGDAKSAFKLVQAAKKALKEGLAKDISEENKLKYKEHLKEMKKDLAAIHREEAAKSRGLALLRERVKRFQKKLKARGVFALLLEKRIKSSKDAMRDSQKLVDECKAFAHRVRQNLVDPELPAEEEAEEEEEDNDAGEDGQADMDVE